MNCRIPVILCIILHNISLCASLARVGNPPQVNPIVGPPPPPPLPTPRPTTPSTTPRGSITINECSAEKPCFCQMSESFLPSYQVCCPCPVPSPPSSGCFTAAARINLQDGRSVSMSELQIGERVQTVSSCGSLVYREIIAFLKRDPTVTTMYKLIITSANKTIPLSKNHLIYAKKRPADKFYAIFADEVLTGDEVLVEENDQLIPSKVFNITSLPMQGAYVPLTKGGNIVVDGVLASCYPSVDHDLAHLLVAPIRWCPELIELVFGKDEKISVYTGILETLGIWMDLSEYL